MAILLTELLNSISVDKFALVFLSLNYEPSKTMTGARKIVFIDELDYYLHIKTQMN